MFLSHLLYAFNFIYIAIYHLVLSQNITKAYNAGIFLIS